MSKRNRIALLGTFGSGKSSIMRAWCELVGGQPLGFSTELKWEVAYALAGAEVRANDAPLEGVAIRARRHFDMMQDVHTKDNYRTILQVWATEFRRGQDPWYWAKRGGIALGVLGDDVPVAVEDCRYPEEYEILRAEGFTFIHLVPGPTVRDMGERAEHDSEQHWPKFKVDIALSFQAGPEVQARRLIDEFGLDGTNRSRNEEVDAVR